MPGLGQCRASGGAWQPGDGTSVSAGVAVAAAIPAQN
jgi:hypothetical protein